jgi:hypothetical protein
MRRCPEVGRGISGERRLRITMREAGYDSNRGEVIRLTPDATRERGLRIENFGLRMEAKGQEGANSSTGPARCCMLRACPPNSTNLSQTC